MSNSINWMGNRAMEPSGCRQAPQPAVSQIQAQQSKFVLPSNQMQQSTYTPAPAQQSKFISPSIQMQQGTFAPVPVLAQQSGAAYVPAQQSSDYIPTQQSGSEYAPTQQDSDTQQGPPPSTEKGYVPYYLSGNIGRNVRAEFIVGSNQYTDKTGVLSEVGINYFVLYDVNSHANIMCDLYSLKFVTILV